MNVWINNFFGFIVPLNSQPSSFYVFLLKILIRAVAPEAGLMPDRQPSPRVHYF